MGISNLPNASNQIKRDLVAILGAWEVGTPDERTVGRRRFACQQLRERAGELPAKINFKGSPYMPHLVAPGIMVDEIDIILPPANLKEKSRKEILCKWDEKAQNIVLQLTRFDYPVLPLDGLIHRKDVKYLPSSPPRRPILQALFVELHHPR